MSIDRSAAADFMATHARVLDRRRFELLSPSASRPTTPPSPLIPGWSAPPATA
jgi:hypothetical protein